MKKAKKVYMVNDFKLMTFFIGSNDICNSCKKTVDPVVWGNTIRGVLGNLEYKVNRLIVTIPHLFKVSQIYDVTNSNAYCQNRRKNFLVQKCACAFTTDSNRNAMDEMCLCIYDR
jgi:hypothetical protein